MAWLAFGSLTRELRDGEIVVGGGADADWRVTTADLMPRHFVLTVHGLNASVRPSSADVVVVLNGMQLLGSSALLNDGDVIAAGAGSFVFSDDTPRVPAPHSPQRDEAFLVDEQARVAYPLINRSTPIGRDASNSVVVRDPTASRFHAEVRREAAGFAIHTMGATGTMVNGKPLKGPCMLEEGDTIEIAHVRFRLTRAAPGVGVAIAPGHSANNDEAGRRPTLMSDRGVVKANDARAEKSNFRKLLVGAAVIVVFAIAAWFVLHR